MQRLTKNGYEVWFTPPPETMIGIVLQNGIASVYVKPVNETVRLIATLPPLLNPVILDDFSRAEETEIQPDSWTTERD